MTTPALPQDDPYNMLHAEASRPFSLRPFRRSPGPCAATDTVRSILKLPLPTVRVLGHLMEAFE